MSSFSLQLLVGFAGTVSALHVSWLPLGDSITWGCGNGILPHVPNGGCERDSGGYRIPTAQSLEQWNITVNTLGSLTAGPASAPDAWQHHEGHPGWKIPQIQDISSSWLPLKPDMITILLGTNDCGNLSKTTSSAAIALANMEVLLSTIATNLPETKVFLASILAINSKINNGQAADCGKNLNAGLPALVDKNDNFMYVPLYENTSSPQVCGDNQDQYSIGDGVHPNAFGHLRVASVWARTIANYYCPNHRNDQSC